ncbi:SLBB domain-containing protein [Microcoleus sp. FACHB-68]|uniref:polysaccharide biosynthesis/export family protein n=1 Tax=Microcoleus sp. FACHB-68 TaxID=2692826 RepID=UPI001686CB29|nr:SLBB domain-containing protein [Microcoleus sp. FACHB-68]MBD1936367.1 SLBB domain-containing protein [Microcoleus sp. FACHB-68]
MLKPSAVSTQKLTAFSLAGLYAGTTTLLFTGLVWIAPSQAYPASIQAQIGPNIPASPTPIPSYPQPAPPPLEIPRQPPLQPIQNAPLPGSTFDAGRAEDYTNYRLGPGDQIQIQVQRFPDLNFGGAINPEGNIVMPLIGSVFLDGLTLAEAQAEIRGRLNQYVVDPVISLALVVPRPVDVTVVGEVAQPGFYVIPPNILPRVSSAILLAGGTTSAADLRFVRVRRTLPNGSVVEQNIDLLTPLQTGSTPPSIRIEDGDAIVVPKQTIPQAQDYDTAALANSNLAAKTPVAVSVTGEVGRPGLYALQPGFSRVYDALLAAGGATAASDLAQVRVRRALGNGSVIEQNIDLLSALQGGVLPAFPLAEGDAIIVPKRAISSDSDQVSELVANSTLASQAPVQVTITGEIAKPGFYPLQAGATRVSDALLTAGGITQNADLRVVRVRRALGDGRFSEETLDLFTPLQTSAALPDLRLATGDAVIVPRLEPGQDRAYDRQLVSRSTLAKPTINVRVLSYASGAAGTVTLPSGSTFVDALNNVPLDTANLRKIALIRFDPEQGRAVTLEIDGKEALRGEPAQNPLLQDNDVIVIGRNFVSRITYALNTFTQPFRDILGFLLFFDSLQNSAGNIFAPPGSRR